MTDILSVLIFMTGGKFLIDAIHQKVPTPTLFEFTLERSLKLLLGSGFLFIGGFLFFGFFDPPQPVEPLIADNRFFELDYKEIKSIVIDTDHDRANGKSQYDLVNSKMAISDSNDIKTIIDALSHARIMSPNHPNSNWKCRLIFNIKEVRLQLEARVTRTSNQGVIIWLRKAYNCDPLGPVLEKIASRNDHGNRT